MKILKRSIALSLVFTLLIGIVGGIPTVQAGGTITVTFDANGGSGEMESLTVEVNSDGIFVLKIPENEFTAPEDSEFVAWMTNDGYSLEPGWRSFSIDDYPEGLTLKAMWHNVKGPYTVNFDANGGTGEMGPFTVDKGEEFEFPECSFEPPEETAFHLWDARSLSSDINDRFSVGDKVFVNEDIKVEPLWKVIQVTLYGVTAPKIGNSPTIEGIHTREGAPYFIAYNEGGPEGGPLIDWYEIKGGGRIPMKPSDKFKAGGTYSLVARLSAFSKSLENGVLDGLSGYTFKELESFLDGKTIVEFTFEPLPKPPATDTPTNPVKPVTPPKDETPVVKPEDEKPKEDTMPKSWAWDFVLSGTRRYEKTPHIESAKINLQAKLIIGSKILEKTFNTSKINIDMDVAPYIVEGRTMVPIRFVAEALGFDVDWNGETWTVIMKDKYNTVEIPVKTNKIIVNGNEYESDVAPILENGRTFLPIGNVARALGLKDGTDVIWNESTQEVIIKRTIN